MAGEDKLRIRLFFLIPSFKGENSTSEAREASKSAVSFLLCVPADLPGKLDRPLHLQGWSAFVEGR